MNTRAQKLNPTKSTDVADKPSMIGVAAATKPKANQSRSKDLINAPATETVPVMKRQNVLQTDIPAYPLKKALEVAQAIADNFAGRPTLPLHVASALDMSPASSNWREISGTAMAYGLTTGAYKANAIGLTELGQRITMGFDEQLDINALREAVMIPTLLKTVYKTFNGRRIPNETSFKNVLTTEFKIPQNKVANVYKVIFDNAHFLGWVKNIKGNDWLIISNDSETKVERNTQRNVIETVNVEDEAYPNPEVDTVPGAPLAEQVKQQPYPLQQIIENQSTIARDKLRVYVAHGKNRAFVEPIKEMLNYVRCEVVVSVQTESTAIPVPEKVINDMRGCHAAIIHVENEQELYDKDGNPHYMLNQNVMIEIGGAMMSFGKNFILLCAKGVKLPSNLDGLYRCEYEGDKLDFNVTLKLLKAIDSFRGV